MIFFDANVLIEALLKRKGLNAAVRLIRNAGSRAAISALSGHQVIYFGVKELELKVLHEYLADFTMLPLERTDFDWAFANIRDNDFEDALQLAAAIRHGCDEFITFDAGLYKNYRSLPNIKVRLAV